MGAAIVHSDPLPAPLTFSVVSSRQPLVKRFARRPDGTVAKSAIAALGRGTVRTHQVASLAALAKFLDGLTATQACIWGVTGREEAVVVAKDQFREDGEAITRSRGFFHWPEGPGVWMLDVDPFPGEAPLSPGQVIGLLRSLHPVLARAAMLWRPSASSGVDGGGITGQRVYLAVTDATLIEAAGSVLTDLLWVAGYGRVRISDAGTLLPRTLIDSAPWNPVWLDFAGPPILEGVVRRRIQPEIFPGEERVDLRALVAAGTSELRRNAEALRKEAQQARVAEARAIRQRYVEARGLDGLPLDPTIEVGFLAPEHELISREGERVTVRALLADRGRWHRREFADPEEPDYGGDRRIAVALLDGPEPRIYSHAHGGRAWGLLSPELEFEGIAETAVPEWRVALATARETARQEADDGEDDDAGIPFVSVKEALLTPEILTVQANTGAGKTHTIIGLLADTLLANDPESLLIVAVETLFAVGEIAKAVRALVPREAAGRFLVLRSGEPAKPFVDRKSDARPYRAVLCTHAAMRSLGDNPHRDGRVIAKLEHARDTDGRPLKVFVIIDEGDAYLAGLEKVFPLGYRTRRDYDPNTRRERVLRYSACPKDCGACSLTAWRMYGMTVPDKGHAQYRIKPAIGDPTNGVEIDARFLEGAMAEPRIIGAYSLFPLDRRRIPDLPVTLPMQDPKTGDIVEAPHGPGILAEFAKSPGATIRMCHLRDADGRHAAPGTVDDGAVWPPYACTLPTLVSWNRRPLAQLLALADDLRFLSATFTAGSRWLLRQVFGPFGHARVPTPDERKLKTLLVLVVPKVEISAAIAEQLTGIRPVLYVVPRERDVTRHKVRVQSWRTETLRPAVWLERMMHTTDPERPPTFLTTYARSSISRGANLGRYRILILDGNAPGAMMNELCLGTDDPLTGIETARRSVVYQASGRHMRWDLNGEDDGLRVLVYAGGEDALHHRLTDDGAWLAARHEGSVERVIRVVLDVHPERAVRAIEGFFATGECTVTDAIEGNRANLSRRQRAKVDASHRTDENRARRREAKREALRERIEACRREGLGWRDTYLRLHLTRHFSKEELVELKAAYEAPE